MDDTGIPGRMGKVETAIDGLRHSQNIVLAVLGLGFTALLALMVFFGQDFGGQLRDISARMDRALERQADQATQQGARTDRLLEQWAAESRQRNQPPVMTPAPQQ